MKNRSAVLRGAVTATLFVAAAPAFAQETPPTDDGRTIESIIVTAQKREQSLQDVPIVVTAVSEQLLQDTGVKDIKDLTVLTPGLTVTSTSSEASTTARVRASELFVVAGEELLKSWESSPGVQRFFASCCGSPLFKRRAEFSEWAALRVGSLDSDPGRMAERHIFVSSKAPWLELRDDLPQEPGGAPFPLRS